MTLPIAPTPTKERIEYAYDMGVIEGDESALTVRRGKKVLVVFTGDAADEMHELLVNSPHPTGTFNEGVKQPKESSDA